jgi:transcriptional regulator with XRE-family HTH domain
LFSLVNTVLFAKMKIVFTLSEANMKFGEKIKGLRKEKGLTQEALGKLIGVSKRTIINYEQGTSYPQDHDTYAKLASALECDENYIKTENEDFITTASSQYGSRGAAQAQMIIDQTAAMFAGGELSDEDKMAFLHEIQSLYFDSKDRAKKFTPKKYQPSVPEN